MSKTAQKTILAVALAVLLAAGLWQVGIFKSQEKKLFDKISNRPDLVDLFKQAQDKKAAIAKNPEKTSLYFDLGLLWKSIAERSEVKGFFDLSLLAYEAGIKKFGQQNILFYLNGGKAAEYTGDLKKAEEYYKKAIEISAADESGYMALADLYGYKLNKTKGEILAVYGAGIEKMAFATPLVAARASYLRRIGDYKAALEDYRVLNKRFPDQPGYKQIISELEALTK